MYTALRVLSLSIAILLYSNTAFCQEEWIEPVTGMSFVRIPNGCITGQFDTRYNYSRVKICINDTYMGKFEVTRHEWKKIMHVNISKGKIMKNHKRSRYDFPLDFVSWNGAQQFVTNLNKLHKDYIFSIPTEAQWMYACRAGNKKHIISSKEKWVDQGIKGGPLSVGSMQSNEYGLFDMIGNVWEWVTPHYNIKFIEPDGRLSNRVGLKFMLQKGGGWFNEGVSCEDKSSAGNRSRDLGFRVVMKRVKNIKK